MKGVWALPFSQIKAAFPVLRNPANLHRAVPITEHEFHYAFTNNLSLEESKKVYDRYAVPVSGRILFQGAFANVNPNAPTRYNFANDDRAPLLFIAGGNDNILPPAVQRENFERNAKPRAISAYKLFDGRSHYTCARKAGRRLPTSRSTGRRRLRQGISARVELLVNGPINGYGREPAYSFNNSTGRPIQPGTSILLSLVHEASRARLAGNM